MCFLCVTCSVQVVSELNLCLTVIVPSYRNSHESTCLTHTHELSHTHTLHYAHIHTQTHTRAQVVTQKRILILRKPAHPLKSPLFLKCVSFVCVCVFECVCVCVCVCGCVCGCVSHVA